MLANVHAEAWKMPTDLCLPSDALVCCYTFVNMSEIAKTGQDLSQKEIN